MKSSSICKQIKLGILYLIIIIPVLACYNNSYTNLKDDENSDSTQTETTDSLLSSADSTEKVNKPEFSPLPGVFTDSIRITIKPGTEGSTILYTTNGDNPTHDGNGNPTGMTALYSSEISLTTTATVKALAYMQGKTDSDVAIGLYINSASLVKATKPSFDVPSGSFSTSFSVKITAETGSIILYTTNGTDPAHDGYGNPATTSTTATATHTAEFMIGFTTTVKALAYKPGNMSSDIATARYTRIVTPFNAFYGSTMTDNPGTIARTTDGYIVASSSNYNFDIEPTTSLLNPHTTTQPGTDMVLIKLDEAGKAIWYTFFGEQNVTMIINAVIQTSDGGYVAVGAVDGSVPTGAGNNNGSTDILVVKFNYFGIREWHKLIGGSFNEAASAVIETCDAGLAIVGQTFGSFNSIFGTPKRAYSGDSDIVVLKLDYYGNLAWHTFYGTSSLDDGKAIARLNDCSLVVAGNSKEQMASPAPINTHASSGSATDAVLIKLTATGDLQWHSYAGGIQDDVINSMTLANDGGFALAGQSNSSTVNGGSLKNGHSGGTYSDAFITKFKPGGQIDWYTFLGESSNTQSFASITVASDGGLVAAGYSYASISGPLSSFMDAQDILLAKFAANDGNKEWHTFTGSSIGYEYATQVVPANDGGFMLTGSGSESFGGSSLMGGVGGDYDFKGGSDIILIKYDSSGGFFY